MTVNNLAQWRPKRWLAGAFSLAFYSDGGLVGSGSLLGGVGVDTIKVSWDCNKGKKAKRYIRGKI